MQGAVTECTFVLEKSATEREVFALLWNGTPINLTGASLERIVFDPSNPTEIIASFNTVNGYVITNQTVTAPDGSSITLSAAQGQFAWNIPAAAIENLPEGEFFHVSRYVLGGIAYEWARGPFIIKSAAENLFTLAS